MQDITLTVPDEDYRWLKESTHNASALLREKVREERDG